MAALNQNLYQKQSQNLILNQNMRQSLEMLALSNQELQEHIQNEVLENPLLEEIEEEKRGDAAIPLFQENYTKTYSQSEDWYDDETGKKRDFIQNMVSASESLKEHLLWQLRLSQLNTQQLYLGEIIISAIDDHGYLARSLPELFAEEQQQIKAAEELLALIQTFDPVGCGASNIAECLQIQARILGPEDRITQTILTENLAELEKLDLAKIEQQHGFSEEEVEEAIKFIHSLEPYPGAQYSAQRTEYIVPDIIVSNRGNRPQVSINDDRLPVVGINSKYDNILKKLPKNSKEWQYLQSKRQSANWLIRSIEQRRQTLTKVVAAIIKFQKDFFQKGPLHLLPLVLRQVAQEVGIHESTVSRSIRNKYVETPWGRFELKYFFSGALKSSRHGHDPSARSIHNSISQHIKKESAERPLSDQEIVTILQKEGVQVARRTVAKYRKFLLIPSAEQRKRSKRIDNRKINLGLTT